MQFKKLSKFNPGMLSLQNKELTIEAIAILGTFEAEELKLSILTSLQSQNESYKSYGWS